MLRPLILTENIKLTALFRDFGDKRLAHLTELLPTVKRIYQNTWWATKIIKLLRKITTNHGLVTFACGHETRVHLPQWRSHCSPSRNHFSVDTWVLLVLSLGQQDGPTGHTWPNSFWCILLIKITILTRKITTTLSDKCICSFWMDVLWKIQVTSVNSYWMAGHKERRDFTREPLELWNLQPCAYITYQKYFLNHLSN